MNCQTLYNTHLRVLDYHTLQNMEILRPNFQRIVEQNKVDDIVCYQLNFYKSHQHFNFEAGGVINVHLYGGKYYLVDGQHRLSAIERLYREHAHNIQFRVLVVEVSTPTELKENYDMINKNTPLPDFTAFDEVDKKIPEEVASIFQNLFPLIWSRNSRARKPHMFFSYFQESLAYICQEAKITDAKELFNVVQGHNKVLSKWEPTSFKKCSEKQYLKCKATGIFLGLMEYHHQEPYGYLWARNIVEQLTGKSIGKTAVRRKKAIPKKIKNEAWDRCFGAEKGTATCPCCQSAVIDAKNHDAGHIVAEKNGGLVTVDNIVPICRGCNLSMGTHNLADYMERHYPGNSRDFLSCNSDSMVAYL